ncbi:MAG: MFS transporter [Candidatus Delongbacteria bacterium]|nr:MFS transporter [Candidatus Delongbacteria bacterium]MCG2760518.1 MFS transporter [Candidatus Delongbacteria bacterium]
MWPHEQDICPVTLYLDSVKTYGFTSVAVRQIPLTTVGILQYIAPTIQRTETGFQIKGLHFMTRKSNNLRKAIKLSIIEGSYAQIYASLSSIGTVFITKFAILLNATPFHFGVLSAIGQFSQLFQPLGAIITKKLETRKSKTVRYAFIGRFLTLLLPVIPFYFMGDSAIYLFLTICLISTVLLAISGNMWIAWISDLIPLRFRGRFFSNRSVYLTIAAVLTGYIFGFFLDLFDSAEGGLAEKFKDSFSIGVYFTKENLPYAYTIIFGTAAAVGLYGLLILNKQPELPKKIETESFIVLLLSPFKDRNYRKLIIFGCWWMLAIGIGAPFWQPFMISNLKMSMLELQIYGTFSTIGALFMLRPWGRFVDRFGNKPAMILAIILGSVNPFIWLFAAPDNYWFLFIEAATSGVMWSGANVITTNFVLAVAPQGKQQIYSGMYSAVTGLAIVVTMLLSGMFLPPPMELFGLHLLPEQVLFGLTSILRLTAIIPLIGIFEHKAKPMMLVISHLNVFSKVKILQYSRWLFK